MDMSMSERALWAVLRVQSVWRGKQLRRALKVRNAESTQQMWSIMLLQTVFRRYFKRKRAREHKLRQLNLAVLRIQTVFRGRLGRLRAQQRVHLLYNSALKVQTVFRGFRVRKLLVQERLRKENAAATKLQRAWKEYIESERIRRETQEQLRRQADLLTKSYLFTTSQDTQTEQKADLHEMAAKLAKASGIVVSREQQKKLGLAGLIKLMPDFKTQYVMRIMGVIEMNSNSKAKLLDLRATHMMEVPPMLLSLTHLRWLRLDENKLVALNGQFSSLQNLTHLNVSFNRLIRLPDGLAKIYTMRQLFAQHNHLVTVSPLYSELTDLRALRLSDNFLTGIPACLAVLTKLKELTLHHNEKTLNSPPSPTAQLGLEMVMKYLTCLHRTARPAEKVLAEADVEASVASNVDEQPKIEFNQLEASDSSDENEKKAATNNESRTGPARRQFLKRRTVARKLATKTKGRTATSDKPEDKLLESKRPDTATYSTLEMVGFDMPFVPEIICDTLHLVVLSLAQNNLDSIPGALLRLQKLRKLHLDHNRLTSLPDMARLSLHTLTCAHNAFVVLPGSIAFMKDVMVLDFSNNPLISPPPEVMRGRITRIQRYSRIVQEARRKTVLELTDVGMQAMPAQDVPTHISAADLSKNSLICLPSSLFPLESLLSLNLSYNRLAKLPDAFSSLVPLETLLIAHNRLETLPNALYYLSSLKTLDVSYNRLSALPPKIVGLVSLKSLSLSFNKFSELPHFLGYLPLLTQLVCMHNSLSTFNQYEFVEQQNNVPDPVHSQLPTSKPSSANGTKPPSRGTTPVPAGKTTEKKTVEFNARKTLQNAISRSIDGQRPAGAVTRLAAVAHSLQRHEALAATEHSMVRVSKRVQYDANDALRVAQMELESNIVVGPKNYYPRVHTLNLSSNRLPTFPAHLTSVQLRTLVLDDNGIRAVPRSIKDFKGLASVSVNSNRMSWVPPEIGLVTSLTSISFCHNILQIFPEGILKLPILETLLLTGNQISSLPPPLCIMHSLRTLELSQNCLTDIPFEIYSLTKLRHLDLSSNAVRHWPTHDDHRGKRMASGITVPLVGRLRSLETLSLANNQLEQLPPDLQSCVHLKDFRLDGNPHLQIPPPQVVEAGAQAIIKFLGSEHGMVFVPRQTAAVNEKVEQQESEDVVAHRLYLDEVASRNEQQVELEEWVRVRKRGEDWEKLETQFFLPGVFERKMSSQAQLQRIELEDNRRRDRAERQLMACEAKAKAQAQARMKALGMGGGGAGAAAAVPDPAGEDGEAGPGSPPGLMPCEPSWMSRQVDVYTSYNQEQSALGRPGLEPTAAARPRNVGAEQLEWDGDVLDEMLWVMQHDLEVEPGQRHVLTALKEDDVVLKSTLPRRSRHIRPRPDY